jgi:hypothetical protein
LLQFLLGFLDREIASLQPERESEGLSFIETSRRSATQTP